jgi:hypothetical protein
VRYAMGEGYLSPIASPEEVNQFLKNSLQTEVNSLNALENAGIPVVKNYGVVDVGGAPGILLEKVPGAISTHDAILFGKAAPLQSILNESSVADLQFIKAKLIESNIGSSDLQFLVRSDGRVFANDPGRTIAAPNPENIAYIDKLINLAKSGKN